MTTEYKSFLSILDISCAIRICLILSLYLGRYKGRLFERMLLVYLLYILNKEKILLEDLYVFRYSILQSKSQKMFYLITLKRPVAGYSVLFYIR